MMITQPDVDEAVDGDFDERGDDRDGHAARGQQVPVSGGGGRVHEVEAQDEGDRACELGDSNEGFEVHRRRQSFAAGFGAVGFLRNMLSIRSVTT